MRIFEYKDNGGGGGWERFYASERDSIDVMIFGSSHAHCTVDNSFLWNKLGVASFTLSAGGQDLDSTYYYMREALKTQKPKIMLVETLAVTWGDIKNDETTISRNTMPMRWSGLRSDYVEYMAASAGYSKKEEREVQLKVPLIHSRYRELVQEDFDDEIYFMKGYRGSNDHYIMDAAPEPVR